MTIPEILHEVGRISFCFPFSAWGVYATCERAFTPGVVLMRVGCASVPHRDSGQPGPICRSALADARGFTKPADVHKHVRMLLKELLQHEGDESLLVDGVRVFDPHAT